MGPTGLEVPTQTGDWKVSKRTGLQTGLQCRAQEEPQSAPYRYSVPRREETSQTTTKLMIVE